MENALWNGKSLIAAETAENYALEKEIRKASGRKELRCPDPECQQPTLRYCHGEIKDAFFAHLNNEHCDYATFDRENTQLIRTIRRMIYENFKSKGYQVRLEVKVLDHHYTHLLFDVPDGRQIAVEIGTQRISANRIDSLSDEYCKKGVTVKWIVLGNTDATVRENQTYFLKRYLLNESKNKDLLVVSWNGNEVAQYKVDPNKYEYSGYSLTSDNYPETYFECASLAELTINNGEFTLAGFHERYSNWLTKKWRAFDKKIKQLEEDRKCRMDEIQKQVQEKNRLYRERQAWLSSNQAHPPITVISDTSDSVDRASAVSSSTTYHQRREEILSQIEQQQVPTRDSTGRRWIKCEKCGCIETEEKFVSYGGQNHVNLGICANCSGSRRLPEI